VTNSRRAVGTRGECVFECECKRGLEAPTEVLEAAKQLAALPPNALVLTEEGHDVVEGIRLDGGGPDDTLSIDRLEHDGALEDSDPLGFACSIAAGHGPLALALLLALALRRGGVGFGSCGSQTLQHRRRLLLGLCL
jgi:hypothetical protein